MITLRKRTLMLIAAALLLTAGACTTESTTGPGNAGNGPAPGSTNDVGAQATPRPPAPDDDGPLGSSADVYLRDSVPAAVIEVDVVEGTSVSGASLGHLQATLRQVAGKPGGVAVDGPTTIAGSGDRYSSGDLRALEDKHRQTSSSSERASLYVLVVNGSFAENDKALGVAYSASAFAIFADKIAASATPLLPASRIERAVLVHELGHILRLVNIGYDSPRQRTDPEHPNHSNNRGSVMFWAVESDVVSQVLQGPPPDEFDEADKADLADIRAGKL